MSQSRASSSVAGPARRDMERRIGLALRTGGALAQVLGQRQEPGVASQAEGDQDDAER